MIRCSQHLRYNEPQDSASTPAGPRLFRKWILGALVPRLLPEPARPHHVGVEDRTRPLHITHMALSEDLPRDRCSPGSATVLPPLHLLQQGLLPRERPDSTFPGKYQVPQSDDNTSVTDKYRGGIEANFRWRRRQLSWS